MPRGLVDDLDREAIERLFDDAALLHELQGPPEDRRRPYRLTGLGQATLRSLLEGLSTFARTGLQRLEGVR